MAVSRDSDLTSAWRGSAADGDRGLQGFEGAPAVDSFRALIEQIPAVTYVQTAETPGTTLFISPRVEVLTGYPPAAFIGDGAAWLRVTHPDDIAALLEEVARTNATGEPFCCEHRVVHADGAVRWVRNEAVLALDATGQPRFWHGFMVDITAQKQSDLDLREAEQRYRALIEQIPAITLTTTAGAPHDRHLYISPQVQTILGYSPAQWASDPNLWNSIIHPDDLARVLAEDERTNRSGAPLDIEFRAVAADGHIVWLHNRATLVRDEAGRPQLWHAVLFDITDEREVTQRLAEAEDKYRTMIEHVPVAIYREHAGVGRNSIYMSPYIEQLLGHPPALWLDTPDAWQQVVHPDDRVWVQTEIELADATGEPFAVECRYVTRGGRTIWASNAAVLVRDAADQPLWWQGYIVDITARKQLEEQLAHQAFHDSLTGLPNRALLVDRVQQALARARRDERRVGVLFVDLDDFKVINDTLGHGRGDKLLKRVARRLQTSVREGDTVARLGGDEFVVLLDSVTGDAETQAVVRRIQRALAAPIALGGRRIGVTASIGVVLSDATHSQPEHLLRDADIAMYRAKSTGKNRQTRFTLGMRAVTMGRVEREDDLRQALARDQFVLHYQPQVDLVSDAVVGYEALVRWQHPARGLIAPDDFIPLAEESGLIVPLGRWVLGEACRQLYDWNHQRPVAESLTVSVNLSARQFNEPSLVRDVEAALRTSGLLPALLTLEVTETAAMDDAEATAATLADLRTLGVANSIDDFGTGYSSLAYLQRFPVTMLKIDRSFVSGLGRDPESAAIVAATIGLAHALRIQVVAEGIETADQLARLRELGCDLGQGYYFGVPRPARDHTFQPTLGGV